MPGLGGGPGEGFGSGAIPVGIETSTLNGMWCDSSGDRVVIEAVRREKGDGGLPTSLAGAHITYLIHYPGSASDPIEVATLEDYQLCTIQIPRSSLPGCWLTQDGLQEVIIETVTDEFGNFLFYRVHYIDGTPLVEVVDLLNYKLCVEDIDTPLCSEIID